MDLDLPAFLDDLERSRRLLLLGLVGTALVAVWSFVVPVVGAVGVSMITAGSSLNAALLPGLPERVVSAGVGVGSLLASLPLAAVLLFGSVLWHVRVARALRGVGLPRPAVGILAPARLVAVPFAIGAAAFLLTAPIPLLAPAPEAGDILGNALAGMALVLPLLAPALGLLVGWKRGIDTPGTEAWRAGTLTLDDVDDGVAPFPLIARRPRPVIRAELLRRAGRLDEADALLRTYLERVAVGPSRALVTWARVHRDAGRLDAAEQAAAAAALLVPVDLAALGLLSDIRAQRGRPADAERVDEAAEAVRIGFLGLAFDDGESRRARAAAGLRA